MATTAVDTTSGRGRQVFERARGLLEAERLGEAVELLQGVDDPTGEGQALLGAALFRMERYGEAEAALRRALEKGRVDAELQRLLERAVANDQADVRRAVPEPVRLEREALERGPQPGDHPAPARGVPPEGSLRSRVLGEVGAVVGLKLGQGIGVLTELLGREPRTKSPWTSWYRHGFARGMLMLARRRERLNREQLFAAYPADAGTGHFKSAEEAPAWTRFARTADGSYNDLEEPLAGAAGVRFGFNTEPAVTTGETGDRLLTPNPRTVSRVLLTRQDGVKRIPFLNLTAAAWIQFMNHDWVSYGDPDADAEPYRIPLADDDPARRTLHQTHMLVRPTQKDPTRREGDPEGTHINEVTSWWDGSQIYGSDEATARSLRSFEGGKLALDPATGNLPVLADGVEQTGFRRNWWLGLSMLHTLFVREHNAICDMLAVHYPGFDDQRLYDTARLINAAVMAKIHTVEWTPAVLPNEMLNAAMNSNWYGLLTNLFRARGERRAVAEINVADPIAGGLVGNATDNHGVPYSLSREFLSVYRLHSLMPDHIGLFRMGTETPFRTLSILQTRQAASHRITGEVPMDELFFSFGRQHPGQLVLNNYPETLQNLSVPGAGFYDLGAVDVLRDRERGTPRYNAFRRLMGLRPIARFEDLTDNVEEIKALRRVYASVEDIDLLIGNLAEAHRPHKFGFGETLFEIFILNASRRLQADRFFADDYREEVYTAEGLRWVDDASLKAVLLRHYPRLGSTGLMNVDNAFEPWDLGVLAPDRHPLRAYDRELREQDERRKQRPDVR